LIENEKYNTKVVNPVKTHLKNNFYHSIENKKIKPKNILNKKAVKYNIEDKKDQLNTNFELKRKDFELEKNNEELERENFELKRKYSELEK